MHLEPTSAHERVGTSITEYRLEAEDPIIKVVSKTSDSINPETREWRRKAWMNLTSSRVRPRHISSLTPEQIPT
jgi:hypothetical protein